MSFPRKGGQGAELVCAAEFADDFIHVAMIGNGRDPAMAGQVGERQLEFAICWSAAGLAAPNYNTAIGEEALFGDGMRIVIPTSTLKLRHDKLPASVGF